MGCAQGGRRGWGGQGWSFAAGLEGPGEVEAGQRQSHLCRRGVLLSAVSPAASITPTLTVICSCSLTGSSVDPLGARFAVPMKRDHFAERAAPVVADKNCMS